MFRRRTKQSTMSYLRQAVCEALETRRLLTTIITDTNPLTPTPDTQQFEYKDEAGAAVRVVVHGDVSAEFVFARVDKKTNKVVLGDYVPDTVTEGDGEDLFHIYIAQASIDSYISIAKVTAPSAGSGPRPMQPFDGGRTLYINPNFGTDNGVTTEDGTVYIGATTVQPEGSTDQTIGNHPIVSAHYNGQGIFPANIKGRLVAGITTAPGVSIGKIMIGGAVTGEVYIGGSIETFYCGNLLTGTTNGQNEGAPADPGNFFVQGDMRNLLVMGSIGTTGVAHTAPERTQVQYYTGTDIQVHGRVGQIRTGGDYSATGIVYNDNPGLGLRTRQQEIEVQDQTGINRGQYTDFENGQFGDGQAFFNNDTYSTAQYLGSINSKQTGNNSAQVNGMLQWANRISDSADYYAVALMAGQSVGVRLIAPITGGTVIVNGKVVATVPEVKSSLHAGVFDPDGNLIATDYSAVTDTTSQSADIDPAQQEYFSFTASKPGVYRFAVGLDAPGFGTNPGNKIGEQPYQLQITGIGNIGLGALSAAGTIYASGGLSISSSSTTFNFNDTYANIQVVHGDLGTVTSEGDFIVSTGGFNAIELGGDFRDIEAVSMGEIENGAFGDGALFEAITGSVGMVRTSGTDTGNDVTIFNDLGSFGFTQPFGGDIQYIVAPNTLGTDAACKGSIGVVQVNQWGFKNYAGSLSANVDGTGKAATIDLIDVTGDLGTIEAGGPVISAGPGGDVRYIHLADSSTAYRPTAYGSSQPEQTTYVQGQEADITDDSGALVRIQPTIEEPVYINGQIQLDPTTLQPINNSGTLTVLTYPIARGPSDTGGGGVAIIRIDSTRGVTVNTSGGNAEIGTINAGTADAGPRLVFDDQSDSLNGDRGEDGIIGTGDDPFELDPTSTDTQSVILSGTKTDVFMIQGASADFAKVQNRTGGEIVNTNIGTVDVMSGTNLGIATSSIVSGMAVEGVKIADNPGTAAVEGSTFPFLNTKNAIVINGGGEGNPAVVNLQASQSIGNVMINGRVQNIIANDDNVGVKGVFEGIVGAIFVQGQIRNVQVGEGLLPSGSGNRGAAGIYCASSTPQPDSPARSDGTAGVGRIEHVTNQGLNSDIRGNIVSDGGIGSISLTNGSIIDAHIEVIQAPTATGNGADFVPSTEFGGLGTIVSNTAGTQGGIDSINVTGVGGIIGMLTRSANLGPINSTGGFGIINSEFNVVGDGRFSAVNADGYGLRGDIWNGGQSLASLTANGDGHRLTTTSFEPGVLLSGSLTVDPFFGRKPNALTDLYVVTGTTPKAPQRKGVSASGSIDLSEVRVSRDVTSIKANTLRADVFNIANHIGTIETTDYADSVQLTVGSIDTLAIGKDALRDDFEIAGPVGAVSIGGSFRGSSRLSASGQNGTIGSFVTDNSLYGNVYAAAGFGSIRVGTVYGSEGTYTPKGIDQFIVGGDVVSGAILTVGPSNRASQGNIRKLVIGGNLEDGAIIRLHSFGTKTIVGDEIGLIDIYPWQ